MKTQSIVSVLGLFVGLLSGVESAIAQVIPDGSLPTTVTSPDALNFTIDGGGRSGGNLFHSFSQLSVPTGGSAFFNNAVDVQNIFARVTGGSASNIDGILKANGTASVFLLNPSGILFGPNALLNLGGSFIGTTASSVKFADGTEFSAVNPSTPPLLTMSAPIGLQMGQNPGAITNQSGYFSTDPNKTLALIGGNLSIQGVGMRNYAYLYVPDGHIELGSVGSNSLVSLASNPLGWAFTYSNGTTFRNITLDQAWVEVSGNGGGTIQLQGNRIQLINGAQAYTTTYGGVAGGGVTVRAADSLAIVGNNYNPGYPSGLFAGVSPGATGKGGEINIQTPHLEIFQGGLVGIEGYGRGDLGNLTVQADRIDVSGASSQWGSSRLYNWNSPQALGRGGNITLKTQMLTLSKGGRINVYTSGNSDGGNLNIHANQIEMMSDSTPNARLSSIFVSTDGSGNAGTANITTQQLTIKNAAQIFVGSLGVGNGGILNLKAMDIYADRGKDYTGTFSTGLNSSTGLGSTGNAGNINVQTQGLTLLNGAQVFSGTNGRGKGGKIVIKADDIQAIGTGIDVNIGEIPSGINAVITPKGTGDAGSIEIDTRQLTLKNGAEVTNAILGQGAGGDISIRAHEIFATGGSTSQLSRSRIATSITAQGKGNAGQISIVSDRVIVQDGAQITSSTSGIGNAGFVSIKSSDLIQVDGHRSQIQSSISPTAKGQGGLVNLQTGQLILANGSQISTQTSGLGNAGNIILQADQISLSDAAQISSQSQGNNDAGNITVRGKSVTLMNSSKITTQSSGNGNGGTIALTGDNLILRNRSAITASTATGDGGNLDLKFSGLVYLNNLSQLNAEAGGKGDGGNINLTAQLTLGVGNSDIIASAFAGRGGNINITTQSVLGLKYRDRLTPENDITASSELGVNGNVQVNTIGTDPNAGLTELPVNVADASQKIATGCSSTQGSQFIATGRGGIPQNPNQQVTGDRTWNDLRDLSAYRDQPNTIATSPMPQSTLVQASGFQRKADGSIDLIASPAPVNPPTIATCSGQNVKMVRTL